MSVAAPMVVIPLPLPPPVAPMVAVRTPAADTAVEIVTLLPCANLTSVSMPAGAYACVPRTSRSPVAGVAVPTSASELMFAAAILASAAALNAVPSTLNTPVVEL